MTSTRLSERSIVRAAVSATDQSAHPAQPEPPTSARVAQARIRAHERLRRQRGALRPLGWAVCLAVVAGSAGSHPAPGLHGRALGVTLALCVFGAATAQAIGDRFLSLASSLQVATMSAMGAGGVALAALQPRAATGLAGGAAVWMALARLPLKLGIALGVAITAGLAVTGGLGGTSSSGIVATTLLCVLLGVIAHFMKQARESQERAEVLLAQLEDARDEQARTAAIAERGRIASELHDVLAHSLSGAAIQLQGARILAERRGAEPQVRAAIERASGLVKDGLANAREAVSALRGDELPGLARLQSLIESYKRDLGVDATLEIEGAVRTLPEDASLALYRGAQEALTNVARYAPGAPTTVVLQYGPDRTRLCVTNGPSQSGGDGRGLADAGGGHGLEGMRERIEGAGGTMSAGASGEGWRVELEVPV
jgi:signal transduction histidine kinase